MYPLEQAARRTPMTPRELTASRPRHSKAKRHHYIPEMILKRFAGSDLHLWSFDKRQRSYGIERKPIARLFREWNLYTSVDASGARDRSTETRLSVLESRAGPALERIVLEAREGRLARVSDADREAVVALLIAQLRRSPDYFNVAVAQYDIQAEIAAALAKWEAAGRLVPEDVRSEFESGHLAARMRSNLLPQTAAEPLEWTSAAMLERGFTVGRITAPNRSFLLGSTLLLRFKGRVTGRNGLADPTAEAWFPIARDVALCSYGDRHDERIFDMPDSGLRKINGMISRESTVIASASRELVMSYTRRLHRVPPEGSGSSVVQVARRS